MEIVIQLFYLFVFCSIIDGIKLFIESFTIYPELKQNSNSSNVTAIIACYNEEHNILKTLESIVKFIPEENIIVIDDKSTDNTWQIVKNSKYNVFLHQNDKNYGKIKSIRNILHKVKTSYVFLLDADVVFDKNFKIPTEPLDNKDVTAIAFNIIPLPINKTIWKNLINKFQIYEYLKSMVIGRKSKTRTKSVHCISGAAGLFITDRLVELSKQHTEIFPGEDLERTLIELLAEGKVVFSDQIIYTSVPETFRALTHQRIVKWWPSLWRNLPLFLKLIFKTSVHRRLRFELIYEVVSLFLDPLKILSLYSLIVHNNFHMFIGLYSFYLMLEIMVFAKNKVRSEMSIFIIFLYPIYSIYQMILRVLAFFVFFYNRFIIRSWIGIKLFSKKVKRNMMITAIAIAILLSPFGAEAHGEDKGFLISPKFQYIQDSNNRTINHYSLYFGYKRGKDAVYSEIQYGAYDQINVGLIRKNLIFDTRFRNTDIFSKLTIEGVTSKHFVSRASVGTFILLDNKAMDKRYNENQFFVLGAGSDYYIGDYNRISFDVIKEFGRKKATTFVLKSFFGNKGYNGFWFNPGISITTENSIGLFNQFGYKIIFVNYEYYQDFDFENFDRTHFGIGFRFKF